MTISLLRTGADIENILLLLDSVPYIHYLYYFWKDYKKIQALIDSSNKVNALTLDYGAKLSLKICCTNVKAQKIHGFTPQMFEMVVASF